MISQCFLRTTLVRDGLVPYEVELLFEVVSERGITENCFNDKIFVPFLNNVILDKEISVWFNNNIRENNLGVFLLRNEFYGEEFNIIRFLYRASEFVPKN